MKNLKQYNTQNINFTYSVVARGWVFDIPSIDYELICHFKGGVSIASRIAAAIEGSLKRCNAIDGLCRSNINLIIKKYSGRV